MGPAEQNKQIVRQFYDAVWTGGRLADAGAWLADNLVDHNAMAFPDRAAGAAGLLQVVGMIRGALPDLQRTIEDQVCEGDTVVTRFTDSGTHRGDLLGIPPTGRTVSLAGINIERIRDGKICDIWHVEDLLGLMTQLGAVGSPARG